MNRFRKVEEIIKQELAKPYKYGYSDCFMFGCAMVDALDDKKTFEKYEGVYKTLAGAQRALRKRGFLSLSDFWAAELERDPVAPSEAQFGDLTVLRLEDGAEHIAICIGLRFVTKTSAGRQDHGLDKVVAAFHIG